MRFTKVCQTFFCAFPIVFSHSQLYLQDGVMGMVDDFLLQAEHFKKCFSCHPFLERSRRQLPKAVGKSRKMKTGVFVLRFSNVKVMADLSKGEVHDGERQKADVGLKPEWETDRAGSLQVTWTREWTVRGVGGTVAWPEVHSEGGQSSREKERIVYLICVWLLMCHCFFLGCCWFKGRKGKSFVAYYSWKPVVVPMKGVSFK